MNFHSDSGDMKRAEEVRRQALKTLPIGEKKEEKNIYLAMISLSVLSTESTDFIKSCKPLVLEAAQTSAKAQTTVRPKHMETRSRTQQRLCQCLDRVPRNTCRTRKTRRSKQQTEESTRRNIQECTERRCC